MASLRSLNARIQTTKATITTLQQQPVYDGQEYQALVNELKALQQEADQRAADLPKEISMLIPQLRQAEKQLASAKDVDQIMTISNHIMWIAERMQ